MSCVSSWRLYPERSITPHSICGSERLFPGLLERDRQRAKRMTGLLTELVVVGDLNSPNAGNGIPCLFECQDNSPNAEIVRL